MIYHVFLDGMEILNFQDTNLTLLSPKLTMEVDQAGSFEFKLPPSHTFYNSVQIRKSTIEVYEDNTMLWYGRPVEESKDFYNQKTFYCEGPLAYFNDTIQYPEEFESISLHAFFRHIIDQHNSQLKDLSRCFEVGNITVPDDQVYRKIQYGSSFDILKGMCLDTAEGHVFFRRVGTVNYIDWVADMPYSCNQPVEFGINLLDYTYEFDTTEFFTMILPLGKNDSKTGEPITIEAANSAQHGSSLLENTEDTQRYGRITKVQNFSDIDDPFTLLSEAQRALDAAQSNAIEITCEVADLHTFNPAYDCFQIGQTAHILSAPHGLDMDLPVSKMEVSLDSASKSITLGTIKKKTLTRIRKEETQQNTLEDLGSTVYTAPQDTVVRIDGIDWIISRDDENGDEPVDAYTVKFPTGISIATYPFKRNYNHAEIIDYSGISVNIWTGDKIWTLPPRYIDGRAPFSELRFTPKSAPKATEFICNVFWTYNGTTFATQFLMNEGK